SHQFKTALMPWTQSRLQSEGLCFDRHIGHHLPFGLWLEKNLGESRRTALFGTERPTSVVPEHWSQWQSMGKYAYSYPRAKERSIAGWCGKESNWYFLGRRVCLLQKRVMTEPNTGSRLPLGKLNGRFLYLIGMCFEQLNDFRTCQHGGS